jgi:hypothetical protein
MRGAIKESALEAGSRMQTELRMVYGSFIGAWFCFPYMIHMMNPARRNVSSPVFVAFAAATVYAITAGFAMRKKFFAQSAEALPSDPRKAFDKWKTANIIGFTSAMNPTIFGAALKFIGASWLIPSILFAVGLGLLVLWRPRSNFTGQMQ